MIDLSAIEDFEWDAGNARKYEKTRRHRRRGGAGVFQSTPVDA
jgi:hypothetical protein